MQKLLNEQPESVRVADQVHVPSAVWVSGSLRQQSDVVPPREQFGYLPAHLVAAFGGRREVIERILSLYPEAAAVLNKGGWLPLHLAACWGSADAVELLAGLYPDAAYFKDDGRLRPIERARAMGRDEVVARLEPLEPGYAAWRAAHPELAADDEVGARGEARRLPAAGAPSRPSPGPLPRSAAAYTPRAPQADASGGLAPHEAARRRRACRPLAIPWRPPLPGHPPPPGRRPPTARRREAWKPIMKRPAHHAGSRAWRRRTVRC